jgi:hypothetical protein
LTSESPNDQLDLSSLHEDLIRGSRTASAEIARFCLGKLASDLKRSYPRVDDQIIADGITDSLMEYFGKPTALRDPKSLYAFLKMAAWRNISNLLRNNSRQKNRGVEFGNEMNEVVEVATPAGILISREEENELLSRKEQVMEILVSAVDKKIFELHLSGERSTKVFAQVLGVEHLSSKEQRKQVKQAKDRVLKKIERTFKR